MIEHIIHLPLEDNDGLRLDTINDRAIEAVCAQFGGCSVQEVRGIWFDDEGKRYDETCLRVIAAGEANADNANAIRRIAMQYSWEAQQLAMYIVTMSGAEILDTSHNVPRFAA